MSQKIKTNKQFGLNLRKLRKKNKLTQEQVAAKLQILGFDMSRSVYAQIECGTYNIRITELAALKNIFSTTYDSFFEGIESDNNL
ncbi:MAG: helix-turn-helix transcriptional regulator [Lachnospiraceae bacterium]|nr:helix-turn-helix transcriptional regulator [Lachnospiraceae bacterium]